MKNVYYQPILTTEEWETGNLPSFGVYKYFENAKLDYPDKVIAAYSGNDIEEPTYMDVENYVKDEIVYETKVTFQDILDNAPQTVKDYYNGLSEDGKISFVEHNSRSCGKGIEFGLSDPFYVAITTVAENLEF